jgi:transcriptional regulator with PAS, ATPase and Fis domain
MVSHRNSEDAAAFIVDVLSRWCMDRLRLQLEASELAEENQVLRGALSVEVKQHEILTNSGVMHSLIQSAVRAAASTATVLIQGETGTGKELLAKLIQTHSHRAHKPMVSVNAGALSPALLESELFGHSRGAFTGADHDRRGLFEVANGGTLFLDEVGELGMEAQVRLLRVLQEKTITRVGDHQPINIDVRIIAATHRDLTKDVKEGRFREDLFYRLNVVNLLLPPLRSRREDIPLLINHFLQKYNRQNYKNVDDVPRHILELLVAYPWPGNIRELENCVQKAVVLAPSNTFIDELIPPTIRSYRDNLPLEARNQLIASSNDPTLGLSDAIERFAESSGPDINSFFQRSERLLIIYALNKERGVKLRAAKILGINRVTLDRKLVEYTLHVKRGKGVVDDPAESDDHDQDVTTAREVRA